MILDILFVILGAALVLFGADKLTDGSVGVARRFSISEMVIGLTIVAFGTSLPEFVVSLLASINGSPAMSVGNIVGSNLFNIFWILGACSLIRPLPVEGITWVDFSVLLASALLFWLFSRTRHRITRGEGFILVASVSYAISSVLIKEYSLRENPVTLSGYQFIIGGLIMIIVGILAGGRLHMTSPAGIPLIIYMALISSVAYSIWGVLLKYNPVSSVTIYGFTNPIFGAILSAIFLSEWQTITIKYLVALVLVSLGIFIVNRAKN